MSLSTTASPPARTVRRRRESQWRSIDRLAVPGREATPRSYRPSGMEAGGRALLSDEELLGRYRDARAPEDFAELFRRYSGKLFGFLAHHLGNAALAEDVLQDTFLQVHTKCHLYHDTWPARPWLYAVALHRAVDAQRRDRRLPRVHLDAPRATDERASLLELLASETLGPVEELLSQARHEWVRESVARLPEPQRQALVLTYYEGRSYAEVADLLKVPLGTVKSRLHSAIARMREMAEWSGNP